MNTFYMLTVDGMPAPTKRYDDIESAKSEGQRLLAKEGRPVHLLLAVETIAPPSVPWAPLTPKASA